MQPCTLAVCRGGARRLDRLKVQAVCIGKFGSLTTSQLHWQRSARRSSTPSQRG